MNKSDISYYSSLLERYYSGETTIEEEKILRAFFNNVSANDLPTDMALDKELFDGLDEISCMDDSAIAIPESLSDRLERHIDQLALQKAVTNASGQGKPRRMARLSAWISGVAACMMAAVLLTSVIRSKHNQETESNHVAALTLGADNGDSLNTVPADDTLTLRMESNRMHTAAITPEPVHSRTKAKATKRPEMTPEEINAEVERALGVVQQAFAKGFKRVEEADREISDSNRRATEILQDALTVDLPGINRPLAI